LSPATHAVWLTAFMAGLLGSGHCFAMCGGIAGSLGALTASGRSHSGVRAAIDFNLGRMISYGLLGALAAGLMGFAGELAHWRAAGQVLRLVTAAMVALIGFRFLFNWRGLDLVERLGARLWKHVYPWAIKASARQDAAGRLLLGLCWGLLPCGLVYTMLLTAASTGQVMAGSTTMLAFGLGTLPSMLGLTLAAPGLAGLLGDRSFRGFVGFSLVLLALWMVFTLAFAGPPAVHAAH
jgi:uncharacterized protein